MGCARIALLDCYFLFISKWFSGKVDYNYPVNTCSYCKRVFQKRREKQKFCSVACSNRSNLNNKKKVFLPKKYTEELAELFGILLGDGSLTRYYLRIYLNAIADKAYVPKVYALCKKLFPKARIARYVRVARGTEEIQISSSDVSRYLSTIGFSPKIRSIPEWIQKDSAFSRATLRGLFDTEGSVGLKKFTGKNGQYVYAQITFTNKNSNILEFVERALQEFGFKPTKNSKKNIYLSNVRDANRYMLEIGSSNPKLAEKLKRRVAYKGLGGVG